MTAVASGLTDKRTNGGNGKPANLETRKPFRSGGFAVLEACWFWGGEERGG